MNIFELNFYQNQIKWKHNFNLFEIRKIDETDSVADLLIYKNHYALIKKLNVFLGKNNKNFIWRRIHTPVKICNWYIYQNVKTMI